MSTEKQRLANRRNALKSTGPKTEAGKAKARRNALKHGLRGEGVVLRHADETKALERIEQYRDKLAPLDPLEDDLVKRSAIASVRLERCVRLEHAALRKRTREAVERWEARRIRAIEGLAENLADEPDETVAALQCSALGCAWLIAEWSDLRQSLEADGFWTHDHAAHALRLLGKRPESAHPDDARVHSLRLHFLGALPEIDPDEAEAVLNLSPEGGCAACEVRLAAIAARLPEPAASRAVLLDLVAAEVARLEPLRDALSDDEAPTLALLRQEAEDLAGVDASPRGNRLYRYESSIDLGMHRCLNQLIRMRKQEPELASIARWEKTGKKYNRRWDGYSWVPNAEWVAGDGWRVAGGEERVAGGGWRVAGGREGGLTEVEPSPVTGTEGEPQATPRVAGFSALREPGAPQPQLPPADPDPMGRQPVSATLADAGVGDWGSGVGEGKTRTDDGCPMTEQTAGAAPVSQPPSAIGHSPSAPQPPTPNPQPLDDRGAGEAPMPAAVSHPSSVVRHPAPPPPVPGAPGPLPAGQVGPQNRRPNEAISRAPNRSSANLYSEGGTERAGPIEASPGPRPVTPGALGTEQPS